MRVRTTAIAILTAVLLIGGLGHARAQDAAPAQATVQEQPAAEAPATEEDAANQAALKAIQDMVAKAKENAASQQAQPTPVYPPVIDNAARRGAQVQFLGERNGFTGWLLVERGVPTYLYVSEDKETVFQGMMYDGQGQPLTMGQLAEAQIRNPEFFDATAPEGADAAPLAPLPKTVAETAPSGDIGQTLYNALSVSNYVTIGSTAADAPVLYAFIDPECAHCEQFLKSIDQKYLATGKLQLRALPIGLLSSASAQKAAFVLAQPDGGAALMAQVRGQTPLPGNGGLNTEGQQLNIDLFQLWKFDGTPILVFKDKAGKILMVRGTPNNFDKMYGLIAPEGGA